MVKKKRQKVILNYRNKKTRFEKKIENKEKKNKMSCFNELEIASSICCNQKIESRNFYVSSTRSEMSQSEKVKIIRLCNDHFDMAKLKVFIEKTDALIPNDLEMSLANTL